MDVCKVDRAVDIFCRKRRLRVGSFLFFLQKGKDPLCRCRCHLQNVGNVGNLVDWLGKLANILGERLNITDGDGAVEGQKSAQHADAHIAQIADKVHQRLHGAGDELALPCRMVKVVVELFKFLDAVLLPVEGGDDEVAAVHLLHMTVDVSQIFLLFTEKRLAALDHLCDNQHAQRQDTQHHQRHQRTDGKHHAQHADHHGDIGDNLRQALVECLGDGVDVVGDAAEHLAVGNPVKIGQRHPVNLFADVLAHTVTELGGNAGHHPALHIGQQRADEIECCQKEKDLCKRRKINAAGAGQHGDQSFKQFGGCLTQHLGSEDGKDGAGCGANQHQNDTGQKFLQISQQLSHCSFKVLGFFARHHWSARSVTSHSWSCHYANSSFES